MNPEETPLSISEQLTLNFYRWERRGRGWYVWEYPVELEPPYEPFFHQAIQNQQPVIDDGRKHTLISGLIEQVKNNLLAGPDNNQLLNTPDEPEELLPIPYANDIGLRELQISLLPNQKITIETAEALLLNLNYCSYPLSFEIIGTSESIYLQIVCRDPDYYQVRQQLQAYFPDSIIQESNKPLTCLWNNDNQAVIVDFGLSHEFMRPLRSFNDFAADPLIGLIGALENLQARELGLIQILFQPVHNPWVESIMRSVTDFEGHSFFTNDSAMLPLAKEKVCRPLFTAVIRVISQSPHAHRAWEIAKGLGSSLTQLTNAGSNELIPLDNENYNDRVHQEDVLLRQTHRSGMILNSGELVSLVHLPTSAVHSQKLLRELKKTKSAPAIAQGHQFVLGENLHQGKKTTVTLSSAQRLRHLYLIGATGTGKSTLLLNLINQDIQKGLGVAVLDPHGDLIDRILGYIPEERFKDVILLDPADAEYPVGLNILSAHSEIEKNVLASDLVSVFQRLSTSWGDQMTAVLSNAILAFLESNQGGTLLELKRFLVEADYRKAFLATVQDPQIIYYWQKEYPFLRGNPQSSVLTRLDIFLRQKLIRHMVAQHNGLNFTDILNHQKILLVKLAQGLIGEENAYLLGSLIVSKIHQVAMARQLLKPEERKDFYLYLDEFHNFITPSLGLILSGARKYNLGLILTNQSLKQVSDPQTLDAVISNPTTRVCFRLGDFDAQKLADGFSFFETQDFLNLGVGEAIARIERAEYDFNLRVNPPQEILSEIAHRKTEAIKGLSRHKYAVPVAEMEKKIQAMTVLQSTKQKEQAVNKIEETTLETSSLDKSLIIPQRIKPAREKEGLSVAEQKFLEFVSQHPNLFVSRIYTTLGLSGYKGDKIKESLLAQELLIQEETRLGEGGKLAKLLKLTEKGLQQAKDSLPQGKGGDIHQHLQQMIQDQAKVYGWQANIEERIPHSLETVDVGLKKDELHIAVEISVTTPSEHEVSNIRKCLEAGYDYVICTCPEDKGYSTLKKLAKKHFTIKDRERIRFCLPERVKELLQSLSQPGIVSDSGTVSEQITAQKQVLNVKEAAQYLGISIHTLYAWVNQRKIPFVKVGRLTKFRKEDLESWIKHQRTEQENKDFI